jgi:tetratricopeptide (TPR) repeat protein
VSDRLSKEELKEDRVATAAMQAVDYARRNARWVVAAVGLMVVALVATILVVQSRTKAEREGSLALLRIQSLTSDGKYAEALPQLEALANRYGSTSAGRIGRLYLGSGQLAAGNPAAAEQAFRAFLSSGPTDKLSEAAAHRGLGGALADQGKQAESADEYQKAARVVGNPLVGDDLLQAGLAFQRAGKRDAAIQAFQEIVASYPRSQAISEARVRLHEALATTGS